MTTTHFLAGLQALPQLMAFRGICPHSDHFAIDWLDAQDRRALHIKARIEDKILVVNCESEQGWAEETQIEDCPLQPGKAFDLAVLFTSAGLRISIDNRHMMTTKSWARDFSDIVKLRLWFVEANFYRSAPGIELDGSSPLTPTSEIAIEEYRDRILETGQQDCTDPKQRASDILLEIERLTTELHHCLNASIAIDQSPMAQKKTP